MSMHFPLGDRGARTSRPGVVARWLGWPVRAWRREALRLALAARSPRLLADIGLNDGPSARSSHPAGVDLQDRIRHQAHVVIAYDRAAMQ